jgi:hypothetical protein
VGSTLGFFRGWRHRGHVNDWFEVPERPGLSPDINFINPVKGEPGLEFDAFEGVAKDILVCRTLSSKLDFDF